MHQYLLTLAWALPAVDVDAHIAIFPNAIKYGIFCGEVFL